MLLLADSQVTDLRIHVSESLEGLSGDSSLFYDRPGRQTSDQPERFDRSSPLSGRYVKVMSLQQVDNFFCFLEIEVYDADGKIFTINRQ